MVYYVYIMASRKDGPIYVDVTSDLLRRAYEHREGLLEGHTKKYQIKLLVYFETFEGPREAIQREKNIKHWPRRWKVALIEKDNPNWDDLIPDLPL